MEQFQKQIVVTEPECDVNQKIRLSNLMRHAQQMGSDHLLKLGLDYNQMYRDGMVFLVNKLLVTVARRPQFDERLVLTTIPKQPKGAQFIRDTIFASEAGEKLVEVSISWMLIDPATRKILRPSAFDRYGFEMFPNDGEYITGYRIKKPDAVGVRHLRQVKYSDLDYNRHVNNAVYADIVCDAAPIEAMTGREVAQFGIMFQHEATAGQILEMQVIPLAAQNGFYVGGEVAGNRCFESEIKFQ